MNADKISQTYEIPNIREKEIAMVVEADDSDPATTVQRATSISEWRMPDRF